MKKASWVVALLVGLVLGAAIDRMVAGAPSAARTAPPPRAAAPPAQRVEDPKAVYKVPLEDTPLRGPEDALVTIIDVSEFQCPFCKRLEPSLQSLAEAYPGKLRFGWRHFPLPFHPYAMPAATVAEEARAEGGDARFWAMHDKLFDLSPELERPALENAAQELGLDMEKVRAALDGNKHASRIRRDQALMQSLGVTSTPTMFVNGRKVVGALPLAQLRPIIEEELEKAKALVATGVQPKGVYAKLQERAAAAPVFLGGAAGAAQPARAAPPPAPASAAATVPLRPDDPARGPVGAKATVAVFSDFQCPYCARVEPTLRQAEAAYPGALRVVWKHEPLPFHPNARPAAEAAEAAREQGKFWPMHDKLFASQSSLSAATYEGAAKELGLDLTKFNAALAAHSGKKRIEEDEALAQRVGAQGTPTLFINCRKVVGAVPFESLRPVLDEEVKKADALAKGGTSGAELYEALCAENVKRYGSGK